MNGKITVIFNGTFGDDTIIIENASITPTSNHQNCVAYNIKFDLPKNIDPNEINSIVYFKAEDGKMYRFSNTLNIENGHVTAIVFC